MKKAAVFSCKGLGDGLLALVLSYNLNQNGFSACTFHNSLSELQAWFPGLSLQPFPEKLPLDFDRYFIIYENSPWMLSILKECESRFPDKTIILNPIATPNCDYPYWEQGRFNGRLPFAENLFLFCKNQLGFSSATKKNGIQAPASVSCRKYLSRVVIHPTSSRQGKNWSKEKYIQLGKRLKEKGFDPVFILGENEKESWESENSKTFASLSDLAHFVAESGYMIGNDSGIGHLASCLGLPTLTICRSKMAADFWRPAWSKGEIVTAPHWIPNLKGFRLRDQHWQHFVLLRTVLKKFEALIGLKA